MKMYLLHLKDEPHYVAQKYLLHQRFFQTAYIIGVTRAGMICTYSIGYYMDYALYSEFESPEALVAYQAHPLHQEAKTHFHHMLQTRVAADYVE